MVHPICLELSKYCSIRSSLHDEAGSVAGSRPNQGRGEEGVDRVWDMADEERIFF
jgi:hypothetical protein